MRSLWVIVATVCATLIAAPIVILLALTNGKKRAIDRLIKWWGRCIVRAAGLRVNVEGADSISADRKYIFVANHHSYLDVPCLLTAIPVPIRFIAKKSLFQIPLFGWGLKAAGFIPIDRKNKRTAIQSLDLAAERIRKGDSILVFPEEGRSFYEQMKPFQRGAFLLALKSELPVYPIAIIGTHEVLPIGRFFIGSGVITIRIGSPIETAGLSVRNKSAIIRDAHRQVGLMLYGSEEEYSRHSGPAAAATPLEL